MKLAGSHFFQIHEVILRGRLQLTKCVTLLNPQIQKVMLIEAMGNPQMPALSDGPDICNDQKRNNFNY